MNYLERLNDTRRQEQDTYAGFETAVERAVQAHQRRMDNRLKKNKTIISSYRSAADRTHLVKAEDDVRETRIVLQERFDSILDKLKEKKRLPKLSRITIVTGSSKTT